MCSHAETYTQCRIPFCYTYGLLYAGAIYPCRANPWHVVTHGTYEFRRLVQFILVGAVYNNALKNRAALLCRACGDKTACVAERYLTLRTGCERHGRKNPLPFPLFRSGHMSAICARLSKGKGEIHKRVETLVSTLLCARAASAQPPLAPAEPSQDKKQDI